MRIASGRASGFAFGALTAMLATCAPALAQSEIATIAHVGLNVCDIDASLRFYREAFGFSKVYDFDGIVSDGGDDHRVPRIVMLDLGGSSYFELHSGGPCSPKTETANAPLHHVALRVADVPAAYEKAIAAGARAYGFPGWDGRPSYVNLKGTPRLRLMVAYLSGPSGELIELFEKSAIVPAR